MGKELYNNKDNIDNISKVLGELPKIDSPDNFEYNLMTRIQNKNFETADGKPAEKYKFSWVFAPASVVAVSVVIMFFIFDFQTVEPENLLMIEPEVRAELTAGLKDKEAETEVLAKSSPALNEDLAATSNSDSAEKKTEELGNSKENMGDSFAAKTQKRVVLPYNDKDAIDLDSYISDGNNSHAMGGRAITVGGGASDPGFEGFMIQIHDAQLNALKAKMDSIFNVMQDSLKANK